MAHALIFWGGWEGHDPEKMSAIFERELSARGMNIHRENSMSPLDDAEYLKSLDLMVPVWTMGEISPQQQANVASAVAGGVGIGGVHGGMCDAFRGNLDWQWMTGGQFVGHPHVGEYTVRLTAQSSHITAPLPSHFTYDSEQYYMLVDPDVNVLADMVYEHHSSRAIMPVIWTRRWYEGRVFNSSLGHCAEEFERYPAVLEMTIRGLLWSARRGEG